MYPQPRPSRAACPRVRPGRWRVESDPQDRLILIVNPVAIHRDHAVKTQRLTTIGWRQFGEVLVKKPVCIQGCGAWNSALLKNVAKLSNVLGSAKAHVATSTSTIEISATGTAGQEHRQKGC